MTDEHTPPDGEDASKTVILQLFVAGNTPRSANAIQRVKEYCEQHLQGAYDLTVIDLYQQPELAEQEQIIAAPTLVKKLPLPLRQLIGDLSNGNRLAVILGHEREETGGDGQ